MRRLYTFAVDEDEFDIDNARELIGDGTADLYSDMLIQDDD